MVFYKLVLVSLVLVGHGCVSGQEQSVLVRTESGWVRGLQRKAQNGALYASFRGVPYAKQPLGTLRFKELQRATPWRDILDATTEGPSCYQHNVLFGPLVTPQGYSEACIHANIHVPLKAVPKPGKVPTSGGLPIVVFYHGGGWLSGSGDSDVYGPEYIVSKGVIFITFNYRLDVLGFLSLGTEEIPGNNGLRDGLTLLRWVQRNARRFGGDPNQVTLAGQSVGADNAHLLSLSPLSEGLFHRLWLASGNAIPSVFTTSPVKAQQLATAFLTNLGLNGTSNDEVYEELVKMPIEQIQDASSKLLPLGLVTFTPVQESQFPGVNAVITDDPTVLLANGRGNKIPAVVGFTNNECQVFVKRLLDLGAVDLYKQNPLSGLSPHLLFSLPQNVTQVLAAKVQERYFNGGEPTMENYIRLCSETFFKYPALKVVRDREEQGAAPSFLFKFSYEADYSVIKLALNLTYTGACHTDDITNIFKVNSIPVPESSKDDSMRSWMSELFTNFVKTGSPAKNNWPAEAGSESLKYQELVNPRQYQYTDLSSEDLDILKFFDQLNEMS